MDIKDLTGLSKPLEKAVEAIRAAVGSWFEPARIRREARAKAEAIAIYTEAEIKRTDKLRRAAQRIAAVEARRQSNIEAIADRAIGEIPESVSDTPVDPDWVSLFFDECKDVSAEDLQAVWARLLAREIAEPSTFSRRTLGALKLMSPHDARKFTLLCGALFETSLGSYQIVCQDMADNALEAQGLSQDDRFHLKSIGLTHSELVLTVEKHGPMTFRYFDRRYQLSSTRVPSPRTSGYTRMLLTETLTQLGVELMRVAEPEPNVDYIEALTAGLEDEGYMLAEIGS